MWFKEILVAIAEHPWAYIMFVVGAMAILGTIASAIAAVSLRNR